VLYALPVATPIIFPGSRLAHNILDFILLMNRSQSTLPELKSGVIPLDPGG